MLGILKQIILLIVMIMKHIANQMNIIITLIQENVSYQIVEMDIIDLILNAFLVIALKILSLNLRMIINVNPFLNIAI